MRVVIDSLVALMLAGMLAGAVVYKQQDRANTNDRQTAKAELNRFKRQILLESALGPVRIDEHPYPDLVDPAWFEGSPPLNPLLGPMHPWVEIAGGGERNLMHPVIRATNDPNIARFCSGVCGTC